MDMCPPACQFCKELERPESFREEICTMWPYDDRIIRSSEAGMLVPGLGPIIAGMPYVLAISRRCASSFLALQPEERDGLFDLIDAFLSTGKLFPSGRILVFEHGGSNGKPGCQCLEHSHLHVMTDDEPWASLPKEMSRFYQAYDHCVTRETLAPKEPYIFAGFYSGKRRIEGKVAFPKERREPQFFRMLLGEMVGDNLYDYRLQRHMQTMIFTYEAAI